MIISHTFHPDIMLLSPKLPTLSTFELMNLLRKSISKTNNHIFILERNLTEVDSLKYAEFGADDALDIEIDIYQLLFKFKDYINIQYIIDEKKMVNKHIEIETFNFSIVSETIPKSDFEILYDYLFCGDLIDLSEKIEELKIDNDSITKLFNKIKQLIDNFNIDELEIIFAKMSDSYLDKRVKES